MKLGGENLNSAIYWIGWGICTVIYVIFMVLQRRSFKERIYMLQMVIAFQDLEISVGRDIAKNYTRDTEALRKQIAELKSRQNCENKE